MDVTWVTAALAAVVLLVLGVSVAVLVPVLRDRARAEESAAESRSECLRLERRMQELEQRLARMQQAPAAAGGRAYVITDAGREELPEAGTMLADRFVLSAAVGDPLVKVVALGHGVRRALAPEVRHRIRFAMRQESKRARKQRRREMRAVWLAHKRAARAVGDDAARAA